MSRSKYPGICLAEVKKLCRHCSKINSVFFKNRTEYAGIAEENGNYYLVDGYRMVRFEYDLPELEHAENFKRKPAMLHHIDEARKTADESDNDSFIELPSIEEVKEAVAINKEAKKHKKEVLPFPISGGRIWVNPEYLFTMMKIFKSVKTVAMTGGEYSPIYFSCDGADGILMPMRCTSHNSTKEQWEERKREFKKNNTDRSSVKKDNNGQPENLSQLKKRLTVGTAFEIVRPGMDTEQRRVITAHSSSICSIVPFDANHRINKCGGSWLNWHKASYWRFENGLCSVYYTNTDETQTESNLIFSIRVLDTTPEENEQYNTWLVDLETQRTAEQERKEADSIAQEQEDEQKQAQETEDALTSAETAIFERGRRVNNNAIYGKCLVLCLAERYNINVPLRTAGWIAKNLKYFIVDTGSTQEASIRVWSTKKTPQGVFDVLFAILHAVDSHFSEVAEDNREDMMAEEVERFFNGGIVFQHTNSADDTQDANTAYSDSVSSAGNENMRSTHEISNTSANMDVGYNTAPPINTS